MKTQVLNKHYVITLSLFLILLFLNSTIKSQVIYLFKTSKLSTFQQKNLTVPEGEIWVIVSDDNLTDFKSTVSMLSRGMDTTTIYSNLYMSAMGLKQQHKISGGLILKCKDDILHMNEITLTDYFDKLAIACATAKIDNEGSGKSIFILQYKIISK